MIFNTDTTTLSSNVAMAEGYDCSIGTALALIDSARNDRAMFEAMLGIEAKACQLESAGYTNESGEMLALQEAAAGGILKKIADLFKKLAEKIKTIFHNFFSKINSLFLSDKQMVKKYEKEILRKTNLGKLEIKWRREKNGGAPKINEDVNKAYENANWAEDAEDREKNMYTALGYNFIDENDVHESYIEQYLEDEEKDEMSAFNLTARSILTDLKDNMPKKITKAKNTCDKLIRNIDKKAKELNKEANNYASTKTDPYKQDEMDKLNKKYTMAVVYQDCQMKINAAYIDVLKIQYKQTKAAFMKCISANDKKLEESAVWADAIAEAAEDEVTDVLQNAISKEEISDINNASSAVKDADVSDDPNELVYSDDPDTTKVPTAGTKDANIGTKEAAFFGQMLY